MSANEVVLDGNEAVAHVAYQASEVIAIYPITPSSSMGEWADQWASEGRPNAWGTVPHVEEMQSEGGAAGAVHGALQAGALTTTFTASQGLLLMIPNMYKIAGELTAAVIHVSARSLAAQGLSIFGDHQDVMACRGTGFAMLCSNSVQEAMDMALVAHAATLKARVPFLHFFDGFRTSHEVNKVSLLSDDEIRSMIDDDLVLAHRQRALSPDRPVIRGTAQNPDVYFQARETVNPYYAAAPALVQEAMDRLARVTGRAYKLFQYHGHAAAERVIILMGSGAETAVETVDHLVARGEKVGLLRVHLFRPFSAKDFLAALPMSARGLAVLDRTKEPGCAGEPLYQDVITVLAEGLAEGSVKAMPRVLGGRYGLSSKEFTPSMVKAVFDELKKDKPKNHFTVGIHDDVSHTSLDYDANWNIESDRVVRAMFYGLGADGTVGANKNSIKIIGEETDFYAQGYFVYDSKKSGSQTISHLRFGPDPIRSTYLVQSANFVACHQFNFIEKNDLLKTAAPGGVFLLNSTFGPDDVWDHLPRQMQQQLIDKKLKFYVIDAYKVGADTGMGSRINTIMQTCFFAISGVLPRDEAIAKIKSSIEKTYGKKGEDVVQKNFQAVDHTLAHLYEVKVPARATSTLELGAAVPAEAPEFIQKVTAKMIAALGDDLPVSALPADGTYPVGTTKWEKRNISPTVPIWEPDLCTQCGMCGLVCPHSVIRSSVFNESELARAPQGFPSAPRKGPGALPGTRYTLQVYMEDCTGCALCIGVCPAKSKEKAGWRAINMQNKAPFMDANRAGLSFFEQLPEMPLTLDLTMPKDLQYREPLFEFSGACTGCGETPYVRILSQMFGDRLLVANATGCSSIYGGNLPTTPWTKNKDGRGPAWSNSLFEDNAEFGFGFRLSVDKQCEFAAELLRRLEPDVGTGLVQEILTAAQANDADIARQRARVEELRKTLARSKRPEARQLLAVAEHLVKRSVWIVGGDGWAYDIGYGGLDHVLASGRNVNILVLDTEVYSNTGGQMSKSTPRGAVAKFAAGGKKTGKKDLGLLAMSYGHVYVARVALGANPRQTLRAFAEAEAYDGPSLILAYSHCIAHGINMTNGLKQQRMAADSAYWPLFRFNPLMTGPEQKPFQLDSKAPTVPLKDFAYNEVRYRMLTHSDPQEADRLIKLAQEDVQARWKVYEAMAAKQQEA
jgi:pyruvate-ferredoxin/flavodoxin oxidoreductase